MMPDEAAGGSHSSGDAGKQAPARLERRRTAVDRFQIHSRGTPPGCGSGTPFILIHGLVISSRYMVPLAERLLMAGCEVHAPDMPGFGRSSKPQQVPDIPAMARIFSRWLATIGIERCHLVANSLGCQIAAEWAASIPQQVATVTLIGPTIDPAAHDILRMAGRILWDSLHEPFGLLLAHIIDQERAGFSRAIEMMRHMLVDRIETNLPRIQAPVLVLHGEHDPIAPRRWADAAAALAPRGESDTVLGGWHCAHYSHPEPVAARILAFAAGAGGMARPLIPNH